MIYSRHVGNSRALFKECHADCVARNKWEHLYGTIIRDERTEGKIGIGLPNNRFETFHLLRSRRNEGYTWRRDTSQIANFLFLSPTLQSPLIFLFSPYRKTGGYRRATLVASIFATRSPYVRSAANVTSRLLHWMTTRDVVESELSINIS